MGSGYEIISLQHVIRQGQPIWLKQGNTDSSRLLILKSIQIIDLCRCSEMEMYILSEVISALNPYESSIHQGNNIMLRIMPFILVAACLTLAIGCSQEKKQADAAQSATAEATTSTDSMANAASSAPAADTTGNRGRVLETLDVPGYSYIQVENNGRQVWLAGNPVKVSAGDIISWTQASTMRNFHSKTLGRTFDEILFVSGINAPTSNAQPMAAAHPPVSAQTMQKMPMAPPSPASQGKVISFQNAANYSYLEIKTADEAVVWLAAPETPVAVDDMVAWQGGSLMSNFTSSSLNKTFPEIYFVTSVQVQK